MLKIWGRLNSINVRKVVWAVQEIGVPFERIDAGGNFGIVKTPEFMQFNPNGLIPVIDDAGYTLWESNAIVRYLCANYAADTLCPLALPARFDAERWMDWQQTTLNPAGRGAFIQWIRTPAEQRKPDVIAQSVAATEPLMALLDAHLQRSAFIAGEHFTMADIPIACEVHRWFNLPQPHPVWPQLETWYDKVRARAAARGVLDVQLS